MLARREHSSAELRRKLAQRGYAPTDVDAALTALVAQSLCSDERFAESFIASRMARGRGPLRIRAELAERGVGSDVIAAQLDPDDESWATRASEVRVHRFGRPAPRERREEARQTRFLVYRGFTAAQIAAAMRAAAKADEDDER